MNTRKFFKRMTLGAFIFVLAGAPSAMPQAIDTAAEDEQTPEQAFRPEEIDQMMAPIALYPDTLLAQVLTASTYPLQVAQAADFIRDNPGLKGEELLSAADDMDWEPSIKSLLQFPDVLVMMEKEPDWTSKLGNAFLLQQRGVMDSVQRLRQKAYAQGNLKSSREATVTVDPQTQAIGIEPVAGDTVYVPVYDPTDVYGVWWYPAYPPFVYYPQGYVFGAFLPGISVGFVWQAWSCDWFHHEVNIHPRRFNTFVRAHYRRPERFFFDTDGKAPRVWKHNPQSREVTVFRAPSAAPGVSAQPAPRSATRFVQPGYRGYDRGAPWSSRDTIQRNEPVVRQEVRTPVKREFDRRREPVNVFNGMGSPAGERAASYRGHSSFKEEKTNVSRGTSRSSGVDWGGKTDPHRGVDWGGRPGRSGVDWTGQKNTSR